MEFERYEDVIDAFERDNMGYKTLTDYIRGENIKIAEIDMSPMSDLKKALGAKDGGLLIAVEQLGKGGITGGKTYHQYHDQFVPPDSESMKYANGGGVGSMMQPKKKIPQLVKPNKDGSRPGYRGAGGYQGGGGRGSGAPGSAESTSMGGDGGYGGGGKQLSGNDYRRAARDFVQTLNNNNAIRANQTGTKFTPYGGGSRPRGSSFGNFMSGIIPTIMGFVNPFLGMAARGIMGIPKGIINFNDKIQNSDFGKSTSLADYLDIRSFGGFDERERARQNTMQSAKDLQSRIDAGEFGGSSLQTNNKPTANITATNLNDLQIGNPGKYATADALTEANMADYQTSLVDEFTPGGIDRTNLYEDFVDNRDLISETATSPQFNTSLINEFGVKDRGTFDANEGLQYGSIPGTSDQGFVSPYGTADDQFANPQPFATADQGYGLMNSDAAKAAAMAVMSNAFNENVNPGTSDMGFPNKNMNFPDTGMLVADASKNANQQTLENIINKDMFEKNLQPAIDNQNKKNQIINNPDLLKDLGIIT